VAAEPIAGIFTIASMSFAIIGGNKESFLVFDSVSVATVSPHHPLTIGFFSLQHSHPSRTAGAVVLTGCEEIGAAQAATEVSKYIRFSAPDASVGMLYMFQRG
jgi:hypothetical protein